MKLNPQINSGHRFGFGAGQSFLLWHAIEVLKIGLSEKLPHDIGSISMQTGMWFYMIVFFYHTFQYPESIVYLQAIYCRI